MDDLKTSFPINAPFKEFESLLDGNQSEAAEQCLQSFLKASAQQTDLLFQIAELTLRHDKKAMAEQVYRAILDLEPGNIAALGRLGDIAQNRDDSQTAAQMFRQIIESQPEPWAYIGLGNALERLGKLEEALHCFIKVPDAANLQPRIAELKKRLSIIEIDNALIGLLGGNEGRQFLTFKALKKRIAVADKNIALQLCQKAAEALPESGEAHFLLGNALSELALDDDAIAAYDKAINCDPRTISYYGKLADLLIRRKKAAKAIAVYNKILEISDTSPFWVYIGLGNAFEVTGQTSIAALYFERAVDLNLENSADLRARLEKIYLSQERMLTAIDRYKKRLAKKTDSCLTSALIKLIAVLYSEIGKPAEAAFYHQQAAERYAAFLQYNGITSPHVIHGGIRKDTADGLYGCINRMDESGIRGWFLNLASADSAPELNFYLDRQMIGTAKAEQIEQTVSAILGYPAPCAFSLSWEALHLDGLFDAADKQTYANITCEPTDASVFLSVVAEPVTYHLIEKWRSRKWAEEDDFNPSMTLNEKQLYQYETLKDHFDNVYYLSRHPELKTAQLDPLVHYLNVGVNKGYNPTLDFETDYYLAHNPFLKTININPFYHYLVHGQACGLTAKPLEPPAEIFTVPDKTLAQRIVDYLSKKKYAQSKTPVLHVLFNRLLSVDAAGNEKSAALDPDRFQAAITNEQELLLDLLPRLFDEAEAFKDWTLPLLVLEALDGAGLLTALPDWLAVEIIWMSVQFGKQLETLTESGLPNAQTVAVKNHLRMLENFACRQATLAFDLQFPLLDKEYLKQQDITGICRLSEFLAHPGSRTASPHILFNTLRYKNSVKPDNGATPPLVHFFRHSGGYKAASANPNAYFDGGWYRQHYLENNRTAHPLLHYLAHFHQAGIQPSAYFNNDYLRATQALPPASDPLAYYLKQLESKGLDFRITGFSPSPYFDRSVYLAENPEIKSLVEYSNLDPFQHFAVYGLTEGRQGHRWQRYNQWLRHQLPTLEPYNLESPIQWLKLKRLKGEKAEAAYYAGQKVLSEALGARPLLSILLPVYQIEPPFLKETLLSVLKQTYVNWQLCVVDDASLLYRHEINSLLEEYSEKDHRIVYRRREQTGGACQSRNDCLALAEGDYIALLRQADLLAPDALYEIVAAINGDPGLDILYSDEDKLEPWEVFTHPYYKPDWSPHSLWARMYVGHLVVYRKALVNGADGFRAGFEGSEDYDLLLRCSERAGRIHHIRRVLYHKRQSPEAEAVNANDVSAETGQKALQEALARRGIAASVGLAGEGHNNYWVKPHVIGTPQIDIIIPSRNAADILATCLQSVFEKSTYPHFCVTIIDNHSDEQSFFTLLEEWKKREPGRFQVIRDERRFNFSALNNLAVKNTSGEFLLFLNNDTEVIAADWLESMLAYAQLDDIGAVGTKLYYPDGTLQHAGVATGLGGLADHIMRGLEKDQRGYFGNAALITNYSAVTAACLMINRQKFNRVNGFDEHLQVEFNDVDLCLKIRELGLFNVYLPFVELYHYESKSRGSTDTAEKQERSEKEIMFMRQRWGKVLDDDPFYSPWLTHSSDDMSYRFH